VAAGALPTVVSVLAEWIGVWRASNVVRFGVGVPLGVAIALVVAGALAGRGPRRARLRGGVA
jgi:uncharacterized membrane protein